MKARFRESRSSLAIISLALWRPSQLRPVVPFAGLDFGELGDNLAAAQIVPDRAKRPRKVTEKFAGASSDGARPEIVHSSIYVPKPIYQKLREIAVREDCKVHDFIMEGIKTVLERRHLPDVGDGRKQR
jgi:hypothetical protein